ncbi:hypothetical protein [Parathermosynechococcus lividus]
MTFDWVSPLHLLNSLSINYDKSAVLFESYALGELTHSERIGFVSPSTLEANLFSLLEDSLDKSRLRASFPPEKWFE